MQPAWHYRKTHGADALVALDAGAQVEEQGEEEEQKVVSHLLWQPCTTLVRYSVSF